MTSWAAKYISKKVLGESLANNFGTEDPYFESVPATRLDGRPSSTKTKKIKKALPPGISEHDGKVLTKVKRRAYRLDMSLFNCCGIRFGWSSVIGIVPGIGDAIDCFMALMVMRTCEQIEGGLPANVKAKMMFNIALDFAIGLVPFLGDMADAVFRANTRNAVELERHLRAKGVKNLKAQGRPAPEIDPTDPEEFDRSMRRVHGDPPRYSEAVDGGAPRRENPTVAVPERARTSRSFFGRSKQTQPDIEAGRVTGGTAGTGRGAVVQADIPPQQPPRPAQKIQKGPRQ